MKGALIFLLFTFAFGEEASRPTVCMEFRSSNAKPTKICGLSIPPFSGLNPDPTLGRSSAQLFKNHPITISFDPPQRSSSMGPRVYDNIARMHVGSPEENRMFIPPYGYGGQVQNLERPSSVESRKEGRNSYNNLFKSDGQHIGREAVRTLTAPPLPFHEPSLRIAQELGLQRLNAYVNKLATIARFQLQTVLEQEKKIQSLESQIEQLMKSTPRNAETDNNTTSPTNEKENVSPPNPDATRPTRREI